MKEVDVKIGRSGWGGGMLARRSLVVCACSLFYKDHVMHTCLQSIPHDKTLQSIINPPIHCWQQPSGFYGSAPL